MTVFFGLTHTLTALKERLEGFLLFVIIRGKAGYSYFFLKEYWNHVQAYE